MPALCIPTRGWGHLFDLLRELGLWEKTLIIVTADHGEQFMEHGWIGHGDYFYEEAIRVPLLVHFPEGPAGRKVRTVVELIDIPVKVFDYLKLKAPAVFQGESLLPLLRKDEPDQEQIAYSEEQKEIARRTLTEKFVHNLAVDRTELYDLPKDPREKQNIADLDSDHTQELIEEVLFFRELNEALREEITSTTFELPGEVEQQLRHLRYLQGGRTGRARRQEAPSPTGEGVAR